MKEKIGTVTGIKNIADLKKLSTEGGTPFYIEKGQGFLNDGTKIDLKIKNGKAVLIKK